MITRTGITGTEPHSEMGPLLSSYQDGLTTPAETDRVESHLLACDRCRAFLGDLRQLRALVGDLPVPPEQPGVLDAIYSAVDRQISQRRFLQKGRQPNRKD